MNEFQSIIFGVLICAAFLGFYLNHRVYKALESRHPKKYESMGKPSLIMNNSISNNILFVKFLFKREWRSLNDPALSKLSGFLLVYFVIYVFGFAYLLIGVTFGLAP